MTIPALIVTGAASSGWQNQLDDHESRLQAVEGYDLETRVGVLEDGEFDQKNWEDLRVSMLGASGGGLNPPAMTRLYRNVGGTSEGVWAWGFASNAEKELLFDVQFPHGWHYGTEVRPHLHWCHNDSTPSGVNVRWGLEYTWANYAGTFGPTTNTVYADDPAIAPTKGVSPGSANIHQIANFSAIQGTGMKRSSVMMCRLFRDVGNDDFADLAFALSFDFHYQVATTGSATEYGGAS